MQVSKRIPSLKILQRSVFVYPTETCYGLGCDATQLSLVERIYQIKGRDFNKPVSWLVADREMARQYVVFSPKALEIAQKFWPGPLTLVLPVKTSISLAVKERTIALRVSSHPIAQSIVKKLNQPIVATSANLSGFSDCYSIEAVISQLKGRQHQPDFIIDGGCLPKRASTTVVRVVGDRVEVLRQGGIII